MRSFLPFFLLLWLGLLGVSCANETKPYRVEVLIFETAHAKTPAASTTFSLTKPAFHEALSLGHDPNLDFGEMPADQLSLQDVKAKLQKKYRILLHQGWQQPILPKKEAKKVYLTANYAAQPLKEMEGIIQISKGAPFHLESDLLFSEPDATAHTRLRDTATLHPNKMHYLDHPSYGFIVLITPPRPR